MSFLGDAEFAYMISHEYVSSGLNELLLYNTSKALALPKTNSVFQPNMKRVISIPVNVDQFFLDLVCFGSIFEFKLSNALSTEPSRSDVSPFEIYAPPSHNETSVN